MLYNIQTDSTKTLGPATRRGFLSPKVDVFLDVAVTLGVMLDWMPGYLGMNNSLFASGTKLLVVPLIVLDLARINRDYILNAFTWIYVLSFLVGVGGSWFLGHTSQATVISLLPTILVLMFYLKPRSACNHVRILQIIFYTSLLVPLAIILSSFGILKPTQIVEAGEIKRVLAAVNWSSLGLFTSIIPAMLGGLLLTLHPLIGRSWQAWLTAAVSLSIGFWGVMLSAQRSAGLAFLLGFGLVGTLLFLRVPASQKLFLFLVLILLAIGFNNISTSVAHGVAGSFITRMLELDSLGDTRRMWMIDNFFHDITTSPSLIGPGSDVRYSELGISNMHIIFGEAYYTGGLLLMMMVGFSFIWASWNLLIRLIDRHYSSLYYPTVALLALLVSSSIQLITHPGLRTRLVYLILGLCIAKVTVEKTAGKSSPADLNQAT